MRLTRDAVGSHFTEGSRVLWARLTELRLGFYEGAHKSTVDRTQLFRFAYGDRVPNMPDAVKMRDAFGVSLEAWSQKPTAMFVLSDAQRALSGALIANKPTGTHDGE